MFQSSFFTKILISNILYYKKFLLLSNPISLYILDDISKFCTESLSTLLNFLLQSFDVFITIMQKKTGFANCTIAMRWILINCCELEQGGCSLVTY